MQTTPTPSTTAQVMDLLKASDGDAGRFISSIEAELASWAAERQPAPAAQQEAQP
jgi:hypothetical protein